MLNQAQLRQQQSPLFRCKVSPCNYTADTLAAMREHDKSHLNSPRLAQPQHQQAATATRLSVSQMPTRTRHALPSLVPRQPQRPVNQERRCICRICNVRLGSDQELADHVSAVHNTQSLCYVCDYCPTPILFDDEESLRSHMSATHNHNCHVCNKRYPSREELDVHMETHTLNNF